MNSHPAIKLFASRPRDSLVLAALILCLGGVFVSGWVPTSSQRRYFPGHEWFMASLCWAVALFLAFCARTGLQQRGQKEKE